jgi:hypothetical protein
MAAPISAHKCMARLRILWRILDKSWLSAFLMVFIGA